MDITKICCFVVILAAAAQAGVPEEGQYAVEHNVPMPYEFGYKTNDGEGTNQARHEVADENGKVKGFYSYNDPQGLYRKVEYVADKWGFSAVVKTNEPGTANQDPAAVTYKAEQPPVQAYSAPAPQPAKVLKLAAVPVPPSGYY